MFFSGKGEEWGRLKERVDQQEKRLIRLEDEVCERKRERRTFVVRWWQVFVAGFFVLAASFGSAALVLVLGP